MLNEPIFILILSSKALAYMESVYKLVMDSIFYIFTKVFFSIEIANPSLNILLVRLRVRKKP